MGKSSRRKQERRMQSDRPRWAGAPGFDKSYRIAERYAEVYPQIRDALAIPHRHVDTSMSPEELAREFTREDAEEQVKRASAMLTGVEFKYDLLQRQYATIRAAAGLKGVKRPDPDRERDPVMLPGREFQDTDKEVASYLPYAKALAILAEDHLARMREATPVVFDPLAVPDPSADALIGLGLPFPVVVADFLSTTGMSLPVQGINGDDWWVGLIAATIVQTDEAGPVDVYPTVTTLNPDRPNDAQVPRELMFGCIRFGAPMPPAPEGLTHVALDDCEAWVVVDLDPKPWTALWLRAPALAAISAMRLLDAVNVDLIDVPLARAARRRAEREDAKPALMVDVRTSHTSSGSDPTGNVGTVDWRQRWTVRGHWKHFGEHTRVARRHPSRILDVPGHGRCVKVWCPPHVKGPADKPLILKTRVVAAHTGAE